MPIKIGFVTCVQLGLECMEAIYEVGGSLDLVITLPDHRAVAKSGRVYVDGFCATRKIDIVKVNNVNDEPAVDAVRAHDLTWLFIIGWSQIARQPILEAPHRGVIGIHPTLLPEGRGRAAVPWAILKGLRETGVTMFKLDEGVDTGPIIAQHRLPIAQDETATTLYQRVAHAHRQLIRDSWKKLIADTLVPQDQDSACATEWPGRTPADGRITPDMRVSDAERLIRATTRPYPGAFWKEPSGEVVRIWHGVVGVTQQAPPAGSRRIHLADGVIDALDFGLES